MTDNIIPHKSTDVQILRAKWHDYRDRGFFMLTIVTEARVRAFGELMGDGEESARIEKSLLGEALEKEILGQEGRHPEIEVIDYVIMEDHCHILVHVKETMKEHLGKMVWGIKYGTTAAYLALLNEKDGKKHRVIGARPSRNERQAKQSGYTALNPASMISTAHGMAAGAEIGAGGVGALVGCGVSAPVVEVPPLWAPGYHDRIVTRRGQIATQKAYIRRNPGRLWAKRHADRALTLVRDVHVPVPLSLAMRLKDAATQWDLRRDVLHSQFSHRHDGKHYAESYVELTQMFLRKKADGEPFLKLRVCGNSDLLFSGRPMVRVRISRSVTEVAFREEAERILSLCEKEGAVAVSPFRSWSEKMVLKMLRANGYDHVIVHGESMWEGWKPQDGSTAEVKSQYVPEWAKGCFGYTEPNKAGFDISAGNGSGDITEVYAGRCAFIAPWADRPRGERAGKADCEIMNELCAVLELA